MLHGNGSVLHKLPLRFLAGSASSVEPQLRAGWGKPGMLRGRFYQDMRTTALKLYSLPEGTYAGVAWMLPQSSGAMASIGLVLGAGSASASGALGLPSTAALAGSGTITSALLALVVSAVANLSGSGSLSAAIVGKLEAAAALAGSGDVAGAAGALASLLASISGSGSASATPYASGALSANIKGYGDLTPEGLRDTLWGAVAANYTSAGSMGQKLNSAASGGVDYASMADAVRTELQAELLRIVELAKVHGLVVGTDLVVTPTSRTAGDVAQTISESGSTVTVSRTP